jgi:1-deoxyxylulose-5-phosphate synthase
VHIALAWLFQKKPVTAPIIGATKITHLEEPYVPHPIVGHQ